MQAYGRKKGCTRIAGHQNCGDCHPVQKNKEDRARKEEAVIIDEQLAPVTLKEIDFEVEESDTNSMYQLREAPVACGNSCIIAHPKGMGTNGPCHCLDGLPVPQRHRLMNAFFYYRQQMELRNDIGE